MQNHFPSAFHPNGKFAYLIHEIGNTIAAYAYDADGGTLTALQTTSTLPADVTGVNWCADIHVSPNGKFVYGSNRGHDSIAGFAIDEQRGTLSFVERVSSGGKWPRNFAIDPSGAYLLAANHHSNNIVTFRIDAATGKLSPTGHELAVPTPVCVKIVNL